VKRNTSPDITIVFISSVPWRDVNPFVIKILENLLTKYKILYVYWSSSSYFKYFLNRDGFTMNQSYKSSFISPSKNLYIKQISLLNFLPTRIKKFHNYQNKIKLIILKLILNLDKREKVVWFGHHEFYQYINRLGEKVAILDTLDLLVKKDSLKFYDNPPYFYKFTPVFYNKFLGEKNYLKIITWNNNVYKRYQKIISLLNKINLNT